MKDLALKIAGMAAADYDQKILTEVEIIEKLGIEKSRTLELCKRHGIINVDVILSEISHIADELEAHNKEKVSFRNEGKNTQKVNKLKELRNELELQLRAKADMASRLKAQEQTKQRQLESKDVLQPLAEELIQISKELKALDPAILIQDGDFSIPNGHLLIALREISKQANY